MSNEQPRKLTRREFLKLAGATAIGAALLPACGPDTTPTPTATPTRPAHPRVTPTPHPPERAAAIPTFVPKKEPTPIPTPDVEILNKSGQEKIKIPKDTLDFIKAEIQNEGLSALINKVVILEVNDPIFGQAKDWNYPTIFEGGLALTLGFNTDEGITIYFANDSFVDRRLVAHEFGHVADPVQNKEVEVDVSSFTNDYYYNYFLKYFETIPTNELTLDPYLFILEKQVIKGAELDLGENTWAVFKSKLTTPIKGATEFFVPDAQLSELSASLPPDSLQKMAVEWKIAELERLKKKGQKPASGSFSKETWGRFLLRTYHQDYKKFRQTWPELYPAVEKAAERAFSLARLEVWAGLWAERVLRPDNARQLYPLGVQTQERVIEFLKSN